MKRLAIPYASGVCVGRGCEQLYRFAETGHAFYLFLGGLDLVLGGFAVYYTYHMISGRASGH